MNSILKFEKEENSLTIPQSWRESPELKNLQSQKAEITSQLTEIHALIAEKTEKRNEIKLEIESLTTSMLEQSADVEEFERRVEQESVHLQKQLKTLSFECEQKKREVEKLEKEVARLTDAVESAQQKAKSDERNEHITFRTESLGRMIDFAEALQNERNLFLASTKVLPDPLPRAYNCCPDLSQWIKSARDFLKNEAYGNCE